MQRLATQGRRTFSDIQVHEGNREAVRLAKLFVEKWPEVRKGLFFIGPPGTGKTMLAEVIQTELGGKWINVNELINDLRVGGKIYQAKKTAEECFAECRGQCGQKMYGGIPAGACIFCSVVSRTVLPGISDANLLILDDLGTHKPTDWAAEQLYRLLDERALPVVATSNFDTDELGERLGHNRIVSRLCGLAAVQRVSGEDWRLK